MYKKYDQKKKHNRIEDTNLVALLFPMPMHILLTRISQVYRPHLSHAFFFVCRHD